MDIGTFALHRSARAWVLGLGPVFLGGVLALMALPATAQKVELYGRIDLGLGYQRQSVPDTPLINDGVDGYKANDFGLRSGQQTGSRWGIRGTEELGGGNTVGFVFEFPVNATTGFSASRARVSTLGLQNNAWGNLQFGRRMSASSYALDGIDPMDGSYDTASLQSSMGTYAIRYSNQVWYQSPVYQGLSGAMSYSFDTGIDTYYIVGNRPVENDKLAPGQTTFSTMNKTRAVSLGLRYDTKPLTVGASYDAVFPNQGTVDQAPKSKVSAWIVGATYDLKVVKLAAAVSQQFDGIIQGGSALSRAGIEGGISNTSGDILLFPGAKTTSWMVGATLPVRGGELAASFQQARPAGMLTAMGASDFQNIYSLAYNYKFSRRTSVYVYYSYAQDYVFIGDSTVSTMGLGVVHRF